MEVIREQGAVGLNPVEQEPPKQFLCSLCKTFFPTHAETLEHVCTTHGMRKAEAQGCVVQSDGKTKTDVLIAKHNLSGFGGWLIPLVIGIPIGLLTRGIDVIATLSAAQRYIFSGGLNKVYLYMDLIINTGLFVYLWIVAGSFFQKKTLAPEIIIHFLTAQFVLSLLLFLAGLVTHSDSRWLDENVWLYFSRNNFVAYGIVALIWTQYFRKSNRVKATFIN